MDRVLNLQDLDDLAPVGYHVALRIGFAFPLEDVNTFPSQWVSHYSQQRLMLGDPVIHWVYQNTGHIRWSEIEFPDLRRVIPQAQTFIKPHGSGA